MSRGEFVAALGKTGNVHPDCRFDAEMSYLGIENNGRSSHMKRPICHESLMAGGLLWSLCQRSGDDPICSRLAELG